MKCARTGGKSKPQGYRDHAEQSKDTKKAKREVNTAEQGDAANIKQNTTSAGLSRESLCGNAGAHPGNVRSG
jgi:hypothetical protein